MFWLNNPSNLSVYVPCKLRPEGGEPRDAWLRPWCVEGSGVPTVDNDLGIAYVCGWRAL